MIIRQPVDILIPGFGHAFVTWYVIFLEHSLLMAPCYLVSLTA